jgi:transcriptional regulator with XRE-family HTH domain
MATGKAPKTMHAASDVAAARIRQVRMTRGLDVLQLAALCKQEGAAELTADALYKLETRRGSPSGRPRPVTVDELLALAAVLNCPPVSLLVDPDDTGPYPVTAAITAEAPWVRAWIRGVAPLRDDDKLREFRAELPADEFYAVSGEQQVTQSRPRRRTTREES